MKFALIGLTGGVVAGIGFAVPILLTGGTALGGGGIITGLLIGFPLGDTKAADWARNELSRLRAVVWTDLKSGEEGGGGSRLIRPRGRGTQ